MENEKEPKNTEKPTSEKSDILNFCPVCGKRITWTRDMKYCLSCGSYLIPFIPKSEINQWLDLDHELSPNEIDQLYSPINSHSQDYTYQKKRYMKRDPWGWKPALGIPLLAYLVKFLVLLLPTIFILLAFIDEIDLENLEIPDHIMVWLTLIDLSTQFIFILVPLYILKYYTPPNTTKREKLIELGLPLGRTTKSLFLKETIIGLIFAGIMYFTAIVVQYGSAYLVSSIFHIPVESLLNTDTGDFTSIFPKTIPFLIILIILQFISIGPSEEILFRGFTQKGFERSLGSKSAIFATAVYFSLFHIYMYITEPPLFLFLFFPYLTVSLIFGVLFYWRKNLIAPIFAHALYNSIQFIILFLL